MSREDAGSSIRSASACCANALARTVLCLSPPDRVSILRFLNSSVSVCSMACSAIVRSWVFSSWNLCRWGYLPMSTISIAVNGCDAGCCGVYAIFLARVVDGMLASFFCCRSIFPLSGFIRPAIILSNVLFPAPLGPSIPSISPGKSCNVTWSMMAFRFIESDASSTAMSGWQLVDCVCQSASR